jgi:hypothetical protein
MSKRIAPISISTLIIFLPLFCVTASKVEAAAIALQNGTGTFSQTLQACEGGPCTPALAVDGDFGGLNGWAIGTGSSPATNSETAVWETATDVSAGDLTITMHFPLDPIQHFLGRFRFSVTTDDRNMFADGLHTGGDVTATWSVLTDPIVSGPAYMTFTTLDDESVLAGGAIANHGQVSVFYSTGINGITGLRLEALEDASLPFRGPGTSNTDGNFVLTEMMLDAEAATIVTIDIKPGSDPNSINLCSNGAVPIAILGSSTFDVHDVNTVTLRFAGAGVKVVGEEDPHELCSYEDVNGDFIDDLVCHYVTVDIAGIGGESTSATVNGALLDGTPIVGTDTINFVKDTCS